MFFDLCIQLQRARLQERPSTKHSNLTRWSIRRLRESLIGGQTTTAAKPGESDVSRELALLWLLNSNDDEPF